MAKRALLIGCNYPGTKAELHGCVNDVSRMYKCLKDRYGFDEENITVMVDTDKRSVQPTGVNIKKVLGRLIGESEPGDVLVLHYSGHGTQVPAESGDEEDDGLDEAIVPTDLNIMTDDDFRILLKNIKQGVSFTFISDSCHSGGLIDSEKEQIGSEGTKSFSAPVAAESKDYGARSYDGSDYESQGYGRGEEDEYESREERHRHRRHGRHHESRGEDEYESQGGTYGDYGSQENTPSVNKSLSIQTLAEMLSDQSGHEVKPGNIRTSLYDVFGDDASPTVKVFVNLIANKLSGSGNADDQDGGGIWGTMGGLAMQFIKTKLDGNSSDYAQFAQVTSSAVSHSGHAGQKPAMSERLPPDVGTLVSGCQSNETSADANPTGNAAQAYGALSNAIQTVLAQTSSPVSNGQLVTQVRALLKKTGFSQNPCLYCSDSQADAIFICE